jgi:hypothetical protein
MHRAEVVFLVFAGVVMLGIGGVMLVRPDLGAVALGINAESAAAKSELRAMYGVVHLALGTFALVGARRATLRGGALAVLAVLAASYVVGRLVSLLADGWPGPAVAGAFAAELVGAAIAFALLRARAGGRNVPVHGTGGAR